MSEIILVLVITLDNKVQAYEMKLSYDLALGLPSIPNLFTHSYNGYANFFFSILPFLFSLAWQNLKFSFLKPSDFIIILYKSHFSWKKLYGWFYLDFKMCMLSAFITCGLCRGV